MPYTSYFENPEEWRKKGQDIESRKKYEDEFRLKYGMGLQQFRQAGERADKAISPDGAYVPTQFMADTGDPTPGINSWNAKQYNPERWGNEFGQMPNNAAPPASIINPVRKSETSQELSKRSSWAKENSRQYADLMKRMQANLAVPAEKAAITEKAIIGKTNAKTEDRSYKEELGKSREIRKLKLDEFKRYQKQIFEMGYLETPEMNQRYEDLGKELGIEAKAPPIPEAKQGIVTRMTNRLFGTKPASAETIKKKDSLGLGL